MPAAIAFRWHKAAPHPTEHVHQPALNGPLGIKRQKAALVQNIAQFVAGKPSNHVLLTGARGTGKSMLINALLTEFAPKG